MNKTTTFLIAYLTAIDIDSSAYELKENQDTLGYLISLSISKDNPKVGILIGKKGRNLMLLKQLLRVIGFTERILPFLVVKII